ncbi:MAG: LPS assembly protein LptD, partial [Lysobacteraceae bacterium]
MPKPTRSIDSRISRPRLHAAPPRVLAIAALPLGLALALGVQAKQMKADSWVLCHGPDAVPQMQGVAPTGTADQRETSAADAESDSVDVSQQHKSILKGNADLKRADQWLQADTITVDNEAGTYQADGSVRYQDSTVRLNASHGESHSKTDLTTLDNIRYQMLSERGNGTAAKGEVKGQVQTFTQVTYSTCDPTDRKWEIRAQAMTINQDTHIGHARNATIRIGKVPILYVPYLRFPTNNQRASGFLYPTIGYSDRNGFQFELPYYINIAPNYDATITPRFLGRRGLMLQGQFRYLTPRSRGTIEGTYLPNDRVTGYDRGQISIEDLTTLSPHWYAAADLNHVSDTHYFEDFSKRPYGAAIGLLASQAGIYGRGRYWNAGGYLQTWQVTDSTLPELLSPYRRLPDLYFRWQQPVADFVTLGVKTEAVQFTHPILNGGTRVDLYPYVAFPFERAAWYLRPELGYRYTSYHLDNGVSPGGNNSPTRGTPIFDVDAGAYFEREVTWFGKRFINTLEPRMFYLRVPYRDQSDIPIFDSQELTFSYAQLFRTNRFTGADR